MCLQLAFLRKSDSFSHRFIEEKSSFEYGQVNHALAAAMRTLVKEHLILVSQLEQLHRQGLLSLQKLWFYIQPAMRTMDILASLGACPPGGHGAVGGRCLNTAPGVRRDHRGCGAAAQGGACGQSPCCSMCY